MGKTAKSSGKNRGKPVQEVSDQGLRSLTFNYTPFKCLLVIVLALFFGVLNSYHEYTMFENDRHFSHLSSLEREMTFRTEMGLYFSFYKSVVEAPSFLSGLNQLLHCNLTEYPKTINVVRKYNVFPEIVLGWAFRVFKSVSDYFNLKTKECWMVDRGQDFEEVESCEGIGDYHYFYVLAVFSWNSLVSSLIFLYGILLSDSLLGGFIAVLSFFFNHGEATRVQWTPPLRESFGYPFCLAGMLFVSLSLKYPNNYRKLWRNLIASSSVGFITTWQFAQFPLLIQAMAVFALYFAGFSNLGQLEVVLEGQLLGLVGGFILLFGNPLLLSSFYTPFLLIAFILCKLEKFVFTKESNNNVFVAKMAHLVCLLGGTVLLKLTIATIFSFKDDNHIWDLIRSKFTNYKDFHTMLYTCAVEFDFLNEENITSLAKTLLLPISIFLILVTIFKVLYNFKSNRSEYSEILLAVLQTCAFGIMAILFMRLKVFLTPNLCILTSLLASKKTFSFLTNQIFRLGAIFLIISLMSVNGLRNIQNQREIMGEYSNLALEELLTWVNRSTPADAVFSGPMPTMANLMLSTRRAIVNNPFYEDSEMRERTLKVYSLYSRKDPENVYKTLQSLGVGYAVIVRPYCYNKNKVGCAMIDLWDVQDPSNKGKTQLCQRLMANPWPFTFVFRNDEYAVLKL